MCTVEPFHSRQLWGRKVSLIERCPHIMGQNEYNPDVWDSASCSDEKGILISGGTGVLIEALLYIY